MELVAQGMLGMPDELHMLPRPFGHVGAVEDLIAGRVRLWDQAPLRPFGQFGTCPCWAVFCILAKVACVSLLCKI